MKKIIILYHNECSDGFGAAWAAWKKFGSKAEYMGLKHQTPPPLKKLRGKILYFVDITYIGKDLDNVIKVAEDVTILDHHISAKDEIKKAPHSIYALDQSGAGLAWRFFHSDKKDPYLIRCVETRDLWVWKVPHAKEILAAMDVLSFDFKKWDHAAKDLENIQIRKKYIEKGLAILAYEEKIATDLFTKTQPAIFEGHRVGVVNSPVLHSEIGHLIYEHGYDAAIIWSHQDGQIRVSMRSNGKVDVSKLAQKYGGGGHKAAAGFRLDPNRNLPWRYDTLR